MESSDDENGGDGSMIARDAEKLKDNLWKAGYADGKQESEQKEFQASFNEGYQAAFRTSMMYGMFEGILDALIAKDESTASFIAPVLERVKAERMTLTSTTPSSQEQCKELEEQYLKTLVGIKQDFVRRYPYGEEIAEKILKSIELQ